MVSGKNWLRVCGELSWPFRDESVVCRIITANGISRLTEFCQHLLDVFLGDLSIIVAVKYLKAFAHLVNSSRIQFR